GRVEADAGDAVQVGACGLQGRQGGGGGLVAQEAHDQAGGHAVPLLATAQRPPEPVDRRVHGDPARQVRLRVEEDLRVPHALRGGAGEVGVGEVLEVPLRAQHRHQLVVQVEEGLKVLEPVRVAQRLGAGEGQGEAVAGGEAEDQLGFERAFDVQVQ